MLFFPTPEVPTQPEFVCQRERGDWVRAACKGEPFYREYNGTAYCVLHFPGEDKSEAFAASLNRKLEAEDFDFSGVWFPDELSFEGRRFTKGMLFTRAFFNSKADFNWAIFDEDVYFPHAVFNEEAIFNAATFRKLAYFRKATFNKVADFESVTFGGEADFSVTNFQSQAKFGYTRIMDYIDFSGDKKNPVFRGNSWLEIQHAKIDISERAYFHTLKLRPHWFVNVDARKFNFTNVEWVGTNNRKREAIYREIEDLEKKAVSPPYRLLSITYRQLAVNAEDNHRYDEASILRYWAMEARRLEKRHALKKVRAWLRRSWARNPGGRRRTLRRIKRYLIATWRQFRLKTYLKNLRSLHWLYWAASGYGERVFQALVMLIGIWLIFAFLYTQVGFERWESKLTSEREMATASRDEVGAPLKPSRAVTYSLGVMTLQKPEQRPATTAAQSLVLLETILGPLQAALLALALRRKFMR